jgi:hypothetical protein
VPANEVYAQAREAGIRRKTLLRAKKKLKVQKSKEGSGPGCWRWEPPDDEVALRPAVERERREQEAAARREVARLRPGDHWSPPEQSGELYRAALARRGLAVAQVMGRALVVHAADAGRVALLVQLLSAAEGGGSADRAALRDLLIEMDLPRGALT